MALLCCGRSRRTTRQSECHPCGADLRDRVKHRVRCRDKTTPAGESRGTRCGRNRDDHRACLAIPVAQPAARTQAARRTAQRCDACRGLTTSHKAKQGSQEASHGPEAPSQRKEATPAATGSRIALAATPPRPRASRWGGRWDRFPGAVRRSLGIRGSQSSVPRSGPGTCSCHDSGP